MSKHMRSSITGKFEARRSQLNSDASVSGSRLSPRTPPHSTNPFFGATIYLL
jgi:hypothetical protein